MISQVLKNLYNHIVLPAEVSAFESQYLDRMNRGITVFFALHIPVMMLVAWLNSTGPLAAAVLTSLVLLGPVAAMRFLPSRRTVSVVHGVAAMFLCGLLVHFGQGPVQIEMHFYFFVLIALLAVFGNPMVIVAATATAALHHLALWALLPSSVFNYDAPIWVVAIHALFVVLESILVSYLARTFFDNVIGLEKIVGERTAEIEERNADMQLILGSVAEGFLTIDRTGLISSERSAATETLFGEIHDGETISEVLGRHDPKVADWLAFGLPEVFDGFLPVEVSIDQLPSRIQAKGRWLSLKYCPVEKAGELSFLTVVASDVSAEVERQKLEAESRELLSMLDRIDKDKCGFLEFFAEAKKILDSLRTGNRDNLELVKRNLHTLKGNAAMFGLQRLADACHAIEDHIAEACQIPPDAMWTELFSCWANARGNLRRLTSDDSSQLSLTDKQYSNLLLGLLNREPVEVLAPKVAAWKLEPTKARLQRIAEQAMYLAKRLGKGDIAVRIRPCGLRLDTTDWTRFWSALIHVVRNCIDHGLETPDERVAAGKSSYGRLCLTTAVENGSFVVSVSDDGRGIAWTTIKQLADERDLPTENREDLVDALFADGLTTASSVSETSGRGVGMAAVKEACELMRGQVEITSEPGSGTEFRFVFPYETMAPRTTALLASYGIHVDLQTVPAA